MPLSDICFIPPTMSSKRPLFPGKEASGWSRRVPSRKFIPRPKKSFWPISRSMWRPMSPRKSSSAPRPQASSAAPAATFISPCASPRPWYGAWGWVPRGWWGIFRPCARLPAVTIYRRKHTRYWIKTSRRFCRPALRMWNPSSPKKEICWSISPRSSSKKKSSNVTPVDTTLLSEAHGKFLQICREEYNLNVLIRPLKATVWVYVPLRENLLQIAAGKEGAQKSSTPQERPAVKFLEASFALTERLFLIRYDIGRQKVYPQNPGYGA